MAIWLSGNLLKRIWQHDSMNPLRPDALSRRWTATRGKSHMTLLDLRH
jgi:hypothetical protein